jgi:hypothetical protein
MWIPFVRPFGGVDEFEHAYGAEADARGRRVPTCHTRHGGLCRGPAGLVVAARSPYCASAIARPPTLVYSVATVPPNGVEMTKHSNSARPRSVLSSRTVSIPSQERRPGGVQPRQIGPHVAGVVAEPYRSPVRELAGHQRGVHRPCRDRQELLGPLFSLATAADRDRDCWRQGGCYRLVSGRARVATIG